MEVLFHHKPMWNGTCNVMNCLYIKETLWKIGSISCSSSKRVFSFIEKQPLRNHLPLCRLAAGSFQVFIVLILLL